MMLDRIRLPLTLAILSILAAPVADWAGAESTGEAGLPSAAESDSAGAEVLIRVNGEQLYGEDVASVLEEMHREMTVAESERFGLDQMIFRLVNDTLLAQEARTLGMSEDASIQRTLQSLRERLARERVEKEEIRNRLVLGEDQVEALYREIFPSATLRILTRKDREEAQALRETLEAGADLETLIREQSQDQYAPRGGLIEDLPRIDLPPQIAERVFSMKPGEIGGPAATSYGWTLFRVEALNQADPELFEQRRGRVESALKSDLIRSLRSELLDRLREAHPVQLHEEAYEAITVKKMPDGRLLPEVGDPDATVVEVGGRRISAAVYGQALAQRWGSISNPEVALEIKPILLDSLTVDELMTAEGIRRGYTRAPATERRVKALETRLLVKRYLSEIIYPKIEVTEEDIAAYYEANREQFRRPPMLFLYQLTVAAEEEAERLAELVRSGTEFAWLARQNSIDRFSEVGGSVGWVPANQGITGFREALAGAKAGDLLGPLGAKGDWRLVQVAAVEDQGVYPLEEVSGNVRARLEDRMFYELIDTYIRTLRERSEIWVNEEGISSLQIQATPKERKANQPSPGHGGS